MSHKDGDWSVGFGISNRASEICELNDVASEGVDNLELGHRRVFCVMGPVCKAFHGVAPGV